MYAWNEDGALPWYERISSALIPLRTAVADTLRLKSGAVAAHLKCNVRTTYASTGASVAARPLDDDDDENSDEE